MRLKAATAGLVCLAILVTAGTGFAAFSSSAYVNGSASAGSLGPLVWGASPTNSLSAPGITCADSVTTTSTTDDTLLLSAGNLAPGEECTYADTLSNLGTLPATATEQVTSASGALCAVLIFQDNFFSPPTTIGTGGQTGTTTNTISPTPGPVLVWGGDIRLSATAGNVYSLTTCTFLITLTGTAGT